MTTRVVFETATIADAVKAAERVAPSKGKAFDKAAGIVMEVDPPNGSVVIKSTNTDIYHMAWIDVVEMEGEPVTWRLPSMVFARHMISLPIGSGKQVTFYNVDRQVRVEQDRTKARFNTMDPEHYPNWSAFDPDGLAVVPNFGGRIAQVEWAADKSLPPLCGIHLDGELAISTDKFRLACVPLEIPGVGSEGVTVPAGILGGILKQTGDVHVGVDGRQLLIMPDEHTQIRAVIYGEEYLNARRIIEKNRDYPDIVKLKKQTFLDVIGRTMNFVGTERFPTLRIFIGNEEIACMMQEREQGMIGDVLEVPGQCVHDKVELRVGPKNITDALNNAPNDEVEMYYDSTKPGRMLYFDGGTGYECWVMPRRETGEASAA